MSSCWVTGNNGGVDFAFSINEEPYFLIGNTYFYIGVTDIILSGLSAFGFIRINRFSFYIFTRFNLFD